MTMILAISSIAVYVHFPARQRAQAMNAVTQEARTLSEITAFSVAPGLAAANRPAVAEALQSVRRNPDLVYLIVVDVTGKPFASFNEAIAEETGYTSMAMNPLTETTPMLRGARSVKTEGGVSADGSIYQTKSPVTFQGREVGQIYLGLSLDAVRAEIGRMRATVALLTAVAFMIGVIAVFLLSGVITGPLRRIVETADKIAGGELERRASVTTQDETGQLATSFNLMVDRLAAAQFELETLNRTLEDRIEERTNELKEEFEERRRAESALRESEERYRVLIDRNLAGVYIANDEFQVLTCNDACARLFGYPSKEEFLRECGAIVYVHDRDRLSMLRRLRATGTVANEEVELKARDGSVVWALENVRRIPATGTEETVLEGILLDITDRKRAEEEIAYKAYHDGLTGLPNRALFLDRVEMALARAQRLKRQIAIMFIDLDDLKVINDTLGHSTGDSLLKMLADRLTSVLRREDTVARVGGDEFLVLLPDVASEPDAAAVAQKVLVQLTEPFHVEEDELHVTPSIGVAVFPQDGADGESLIRNADGAMYRVKEAGGNGIVLCSAVGKGTVGRLSLEAELRTAIARDEFVVYYQPQVALKDGELIGMEALTRWHHPSRSVIEPSGFIPIAEHTGLITALGECVLRRSCQQVVAWQKAGLSPPPVSVNVSGRQFYQRDFIGMVKRVVDETGIDTKLLELEITETVALQKTDHGIRLLGQLRDLGITIAIDDFGTGQSSLSYLKNFPLDTLKIDRSFIREITNRPSDESIVTAVLLLAEQLGLRTVAEGVETEAQWKFLLEKGCGAAQGFLISRPIPGEAFAKSFLVADSTLPFGQKNTEADVLF